MAEVYNNSDSIELLRKSLNDTIADLKKQQGACKKAIEGAASFWKDDKYPNFSQDYDKATELFKILFKKMEDYDTKLQTLEMRLREYDDLNPRISKR